MPPEKGSQSLLFWFVDKVFEPTTRLGHGGPFAEAELDEGDVFGHGGGLT